MRILVACEESQAVTIELRRLGHEAYSRYSLKSNRDQKTRSRTFHGIAKAMAEQWAG